MTPPAIVAVAATVGTPTRAVGPLPAVLRQAAGQFVILHYVASGGYALALAVYGTNTIAILAQSKSAGAWQVISVRPGAMGESDLLAYGVPLKTARAIAASVFDAPGLTPSGT
jgi:hypothetical protein